MAFNLTRAAATLAGGTVARATTASILGTLIAVPARVTPRPAGSCCSYRRTGPGKTGGPPCSSGRADHPARSPPDHRPDRARPKDPQNPTPRSGAHPRPPPYATQQRSTTCHIPADPRIEVECVIVPPWAPHNDLHVLLGQPGHDA